MKIGQRRQSGFTLIELVMVIVILGILAATALPKFVDLQADAEKSAIKGVAGGLGSAAAINYAGCAAVNQVAATSKCVKVTKCSEVGSLLMSPAITLGTTADATAYYLAADAEVAAASAVGSTATCTLRKGLTTGTVYESTYTVIKAGN